MPSADDNSYGNMARSSLKLKGVETTSKKNKKKEKEKKKLTIEVKRILENIPKEATITNDSNNDCTMAKLSSKKNEEKMENQPTKLKAPSFLDKQGVKDFNFNIPK